MNCFVTGATGFLGSHLTKQLLADGHTVYILIRKTTNLDILNLHHPRLHNIIGDIRDTNTFSSIFNKIDWIFHCASVVSFYKKQQKTMYEINVEGTQNLIELSLSFKIKRFLYVSSVNALGYPTSGEIGNETTTYNWGKYHIPYMETKFLAEQKVLKAISKGLNAVIVNPGTMFGSKDIYKHSGEYIININKRILKTYIQGGFTQCIVDRVAQGVLLAIKKGRIGERYILGGFNYSYKQLFELIAEVLDRPPPTIKIPSIIFPIAGYILYSIDLLKRTTPRITPELIKIAEKYLFYSSKKAMEELGYNPGTKEDLKKAIKEQVLFYKKNNLL